MNDSDIPGDEAGEDDPKASAAPLARPPWTLMSAYCMMASRFTLVFRSQPQLQSHFYGTARWGRMHFSSH
ncbi:hypothetical protein T492DRAFT_940329, partial [Pavlovales sp. CCMP2436]